jgi:hypothetical protein
MKIILFDLINYQTLCELSQLLRSQHNEIHDVQAVMEHIPTGNRESAVDQLWYLGTVVTKLADMFSGQIVNPDTEFIFDTTLTFLNTSVTALANEQSMHVTVTDFRKLL